MLRDVTGQPPVSRMSVVRGVLAFADGRPRLAPEAAEAARAAAVQAAKEASRALPTVHPVAVTGAFCDVAEGPGGWAATVTVQAHARTTLEASAAAGVAAALLTLWEAGKEARPRVASIELVQNVA